MAAAAEHGGERSEVPLAEAQCAQLLLSVQPHEHHRGVRSQRGASRRGEDEEVPPQAGARTESASESFYRLPVKQDFGIKLYI